MTLLTVDLEQRSQNIFIRENLKGFDVEYSEYVLTYQPYQ